MANIYYFLQILVLLSARAIALRPARLVRQIETCGVACGGGWCCAEFETCVPNPGDDNDGDWGCIFEGVSNADGSPITDEPYNPSAFNGEFTSLSGLFSQDSIFISSLTSALSITSLSVSSITTLPSVGGFTPTNIAPSSTAPTTAPNTTPSLPPTSTITPSPKAPSSSPASSSSSPSSISSSKISISTASTNTTATPTPTPTPSIVSTSGTNRKYIENGSIVALIASCIAAAAVGSLL